MKSNSPLLSVRHLTTEILIGKEVYRVVDDVSFDLAAGKTLALVGESGCGKSLTALSLMRLLPYPLLLPSKGEVFFKGKNLLQVSENEMRRIRGKNIAMIFQDPSSALNPVYTIGNQLLEVARWHLELDEEAAMELCIDALKNVGIPSPDARMEEYPHQLSGGMRQRIMIAMALLCRPDVLIADEPTTALDVTIQDQVLELMRDLQRKQRTAVILITHDWGVVAEMADEVMVMYASKVVEQGKSRQIFDNPSHPYTKALFQSMPTLESRKGALKAIRGSVPTLTAYPQGCRFHPRCDYAMEVCRKGSVPDFSVGDQGHRAACWLHDRKEYP